MVNHKVVLLLLIVCISLSQSRLFTGQCRERPTPVVKPFIYKLYLGIWYEMEWYDDEYPTDDECIKFTYTNTGKHEFNVTLEVKKSNDSWREEVYHGHGALSFPPRRFWDMRGQLNTTFSADADRINYQILATDYFRYAFVWDCANVNSTHYNEKMWYFSRFPDMDYRMPKVSRLINRYFDEKYIRKTYHGKECNHRKASLD